jgi:hypothetical protein
MVWTERLQIAMDQADGEKLGVSEREDYCLQETIAKVCICIYIYVYMYTYSNMCICIHVNKCIYIHSCINTWHIYIYIYIYVYMYIYVYIYMNFYIRAWYQRPIWLRPWDGCKGTDIGMRCMHYCPHILRYVNRIFLDCKSIMYTYICIYIYIHRYIQIYTNIYVYTNIHIFVHIYIGTSSSD